MPQANSYAIYKPEILQSIRLRVSSHWSKFQSSPTMKFPSPKPNVNHNMSLLAFQQAHNQKKSPWEFQVMSHFPKPVKSSLNLPYLEVHEFKQFQTRSWRPGETSKNLEDTSKHQGGSDIILPWTNNCGIKRIFTFVNLPFLKAFTFARFEDQQLYHFDHSLLILFMLNMDVPRYHDFMTKLSKFKQIIKFPYFGQNPIILFND